MRRIVISAAMIWWICAVAFGQKDAAELARLRIQLGLSRAIPIKIAGAQALPSERPLKVFLSTASDGLAYKEVLLSIQKINARPEKYGAIEVVDDLSKANVVLVHYELSEKRHEEDVNNTMGSGSNSGTVNEGKSVGWTSTVVRGYVIVRSSGGFEVLARYEHKVKLDEPRKDLSDALLRVLKRHADARKK
jgi:hypothetical protein